MTLEGCRASRKFLLSLLLFSLSQASAVEGTRWQAIPSITGDSAESSHTSLQRQSNVSGGSSGYPFGPGEKFVYFSHNGDNNAGSGHKKASISCEVGEAMHLNRTLVVDSTWGVAKYHNNGKSARQNVTLYIDLNNMQKYVKVILLEEFLSKWHSWDAQYPDTPIPVVRASIVHPSSRTLRTVAATIIRRSPARRAMYGFLLCGVNKEVSMVYEAVQPALQLKEMAADIAATIGSDYTALHIRRGDKVAKWWRWPHLDNDTHPGHILQVLKEKDILPGATLYIATDENDPHFFDPMKLLYKVFQMSDFGHLWAPYGKWWNHSQSLLPPGISFEPDGVMRGIVDSQVIKLANLKLETFFDFTSDPYHGFREAKAP